ncbi:hypothetical protein N7489_004037 [Penicillium chrysogenum]|uniref:uncharacterized protein n=1 Tax=Penicillium chrysogenum TaxID=5076 RepID=UPI0024DF253C|nr:uncharacterized protein N7489_004037 [Penicillium chrysogenum]KAJ5243941.1 hypothetical protein N7489_004037 [Penicillium chrysogenum]
MASLGLAYLDSSDADPVSDCEIVPESPPTLPSTNPTIPALPSNLPSTETPSETFTFPILPVNQQFRTHEEAREAVNTFARPHGYAVTSIRSKFTKKGVKKTVPLICDRGREPETNTDEPRPQKRQRSTLRLRCPFKMTLRLNLLTGLWYLTIENPVHNHPPSPASTHPIQRALDLDNKRDNVENRLRQGYTTKQIVTELREADPDTILVPRDIYNTRRKLSDEFLAGRTPLQALLMELPKDGNWIFKYELDDSHVSGLFCMHKTSIAMLQMNPWVISIDCTYKTNRYGLPLLDIVGFAATGSTFHIGFCFMRDEKDDSYEVMLSCLAEVYESLGLTPPRTILTDKEKALMNAIKTVFPETKNMLCIWHINMNILKKARPLLADQVAQARREHREALGVDPRTRLTPTEAQEDRVKAEDGWKKMLRRWNRVVYALTIEEKDREWTNFKERYVDPLFTPLLDYI